MSQPDNASNVLGQSSGASIEELMLAMTRKLDDAVSKINQSVDERLRTGLAEVHQRMDEELQTAQSRRISGASQLPAEKDGQTSSEHDGRSWADRVAGRTRTSEPVRSWADRMSDGEVSDEESQPSAKKAKPDPTSEETREVFKKAFTATLSNSARREIRTRAPEPDLPFTRCPKVDPLFKTADSRFSGNAEAKQTDGDLQRIQALMLDMTGPLLELMKATESEAEEATRHPREMIEDVITLLGNAVGQTSKVRRKRILKACNPDVQDLADEEEVFGEALPNLFGQKFETKMKERAESVRLLRKGQSTQSGTS